MKKMLRTMLAILPLAAFAVGCSEAPPAKPTPKPELGKAETKVEVGKEGVKVDTPKGTNVEVTPKDGGGVKVETEKKK